MPSRPVPAGVRDRVVTIQRRPVVDTVGGSGFPVETWTTLAEGVWMQKVDVRGDESFQANQLTASVGIQWAMPYRPDMDPELVDVPKRRRLLYSGRTYDITDAVQLGRREGVLVTTVGTTQAVEVVLP